jgi:hypothetical protein
MTFKKERAVHILFLISVLSLFLLFSGCSKREITETNGKQYSSVLEDKIKLYGTAVNDSAVSKRSYLPAEMFVNLPEMPDDFYEMRSVVQTNKVKDLSQIGEEYWQQPEWFPLFEENLKLLQNPPENRWGAQGYMSYPADSVSVVDPGNLLNIYFYIKSGYLVETYQGIKLEASFPESSTVGGMESMVDGTKTVTQNKDVSKYFEVKIEPDLFILEPNFPIYKINGTRRIHATVKVNENTPSGNYAIAIDTASVPEDKEQEWILEYKNLYVSGGMTKIDRPYYQAFITVRGGAQ